MVLKKKRVLFVCVENSCRSQMAEGFAAHLGNNVLEVYSAGSKPSGKINPDAVKVMQEAGINISAQQSKGFNDLPLREFDYVITLGCQDTCPFIPAKNHIDWHIDDPKGKDIDFFRRVRDEIQGKVRILVEVLAAMERRERK